MGAFVKNTKLFLFAFIVVIFYSCSVKYEEVTEKQVIKLGSILESSQTENIFEEARYVKLASNRDILIGDQLNSLYEDGVFYIQDLSQQHCILIFNEDGNFINRVGKRGRGPQEYQRAMDFDVRKDTIDILTSEKGKAAIISYLKTGEFCKMVKTDFYAFSFVSVSNNNYLLSTSFNKSVHSHRIYHINQEGKEIAKMLSNNTKLDMPFDENNFSTFNDKVFFHEAFNNTVYQFTGDTLQPVYDFDFGRYAIPEEFFDMDINEGFEMIIKQGVASIKSFYTNNEFIFCEIAKQNETEPAKLFHIIYNKKTGETKSQVINNDSYIFNYPVGINDKNEIMFLVFPIGDIQHEFKKYGLNFSVADFDEKDYPLVVFCAL